MKKMKGESAYGARPRDGMEPFPEVFYYHIAQDALKIARSETAEDDESEFQREKAIVTAMVFSAFCLEAFINQEYDNHPEAKKILEDNDSISLETKWLLLPLLLGAKGTFNKGARPFQVFKELIRVRNKRLVHFKPRGETRPTPTGESQKEPYWGNLVGDIKRAESYVKCIEDMVNELHKITSGKTRNSQFLSSSRYISKVWASLTCSYESLDEKGRA